VGIINPKDNDFGVVYKNPSSNYFTKTFRTNSLGNIICQG